MGLFLSTLFFSIFSPMVGSRLRLAVIVGHEPDDGERNLEAIRSEGSLPFSADPRAAYLYSVGPMGPEP